jgi:hypothetical protein
VCVILDEAHVSGITLFLQKIGIENLQIIRAHGEQYQEPKEEQKHDQITD